MEPVRTLRVLEKYVAQAVFLLFVTRVLLFSHVAVDCFFRKFRKFRSYLFLASAEDEWGSQLLQLHSYAFVSLANRHYELLLESTFRAQ